MEALNIDLNKYQSARTRHTLNKALVEHQVLLFRNQRLEDSRIHEVASWFGKVRAFPRGYRGEERISGVRHITNLGNDGRPSGRHPDPFSQEWHADGAWMPTPAKATLLYALEVPNANGSTQFADMYGGLESFTETERRQLEKTEVVHDVELSRLLRYRNIIHLSTQQRMRLWLRFFKRRLDRRATIHPAIRTSPDTGRQALVLGCDAWKIHGMGLRRGMREVDELTKRSIRDELILTHHWCPGDVLVWDNRSLLHRATDYDLHNNIRVMRQVVLIE
jgi:taurine dioxygenase